MHPALALLSWSPADLANHLWQSSVIALVLLLLMALCARLSARTRLALGWIALAKFALPFGFFTPFITLLGGNPDRWLVERIFSAPVAPQAVSAVLSPAMELPPGPDAGPGPASEASPSLAPLVFFSTPRILVTIWLAGFATLYGGWIIGGIRLRRRLLAEATAVSPAMAGHIANAAAKAGMDALPRCLAVRDSHGPALLGVFSPILTLSHGLEDKLTPSELEAVLLHEFIHLRRRDPLALAVHVAAVSALWFNPVAWLLSRWIRLETEKACDEGVLDLTAQPEVYAQGILKVVHLALGLPEPHLLSVITPPVVSRVKNILRHEARSDRRWLRAAAVASGLVLLALGGGQAVADANAAIRPDPAPAGTAIMTSRPAVRYLELTLSPEPQDSEASQAPVVDDADLGVPKINSGVLSPTLPSHAFLAQTEPSPTTRDSLPPSINNTVDQAGNAAHPSAESVPAVGGPSLIEKSPALNSGGSPFAEIEPANLHPLSTPGVNSAGGDAVVLSPIESVSSSAPMDASRGPNEFAAAAPVGPTPYTTLADLISTPVSTASSSTRFPPVEIASAASFFGQTESSVRQVPEPAVPDQTPKPILQANAVYPANLKRLRIEGFAEVKFTVGANGLVQNPRVLASNDRAFEQAALQAVAKWQFQAGRKGGRPVATEMSIVINFHLTDSEKTTPARQAVPVFASASPSTRARVIPAALTAGENSSPVITFKVAPEYPADLKQHGKDGEVALNYVVDDKGDVQNARVQSSSDRGFEKVALDAVRRWKFTPGVTNGQLAAAAQNVTIRFRLLPEGARSAMSQIQTPEVDRTGTGVLTIVDTMPQALPEVSPAYALKDVDVPPSPTTQSPAVYPADLKRMGIEGNADIAFVVDENGNVQNVRVLSSSQREFEPAAMAAIQKWKFRPGRKDGKAVSVAMSVLLNFHLGGRF